LQGSEMTSVANQLIYNQLLMLQEQIREVSIEFKDTLNLAKLTNRELRLGRIEIDAAKGRLGFVE
jgi:hypothetical protein